MVWGRRSRQQTKAVHELISEAETVLNGRTLERYIARRERVPAWSLIALLGHGSRLDLVRLGSPGVGPDPNGWSGTVARLARELLRLSPDQAGLTRIQRRSLIPLELNLLGGHTAPPTSPANLYEMVADSLELPLYPEF